MVLNFIISAIAVPFVIQIAFADLYRSSYERDVSLELRRGVLPGVTDIKKANFKLIGTSENFIFIFEKNKNQSFIVPTSNIVGMAIKP